MSIYEDHPRFQQSQLYRELTGLLSLSPFDRHNSAPRKQMWASHIGQTPVIAHPTERRNQTGMEDEYGKYTFAVRMPCDAQIIRIIPRYQRTMDQDSIASPGEVLVIYENMEDSSIGCLSLPQFYSHHQHFGFRYAPTEFCKKLHKGMFVPKDTVLLDSPNMSPDGRYRYGIEANVAFMSHPATSEDGILVSRSFLPKMGIKMFETRVVEWGSKQSPLNLYGDENTFKPHPDIGDLIPDHGMVMAFRSYDEVFAPVEQSVSSVQKISHIFDKAVYAGPGGRVIDIQVMHDEESMPPATLTRMDEQVSKYNRARLHYYEQIKTEYDRLHRERGDALRCTPEFHRLIVETISVVSPNRKAEKGQPRERVSKEHRGVPLDDWRVKFVIEYDIVPTMGFKITDGQGGKGVVCAVANEEDMPIDQAGNRADIVMDPGATVSRMNLGRLYEQFLNGTSRDLTTELRTLLDVPVGQIKHNVKLQPSKIRQHPNFETAKARLLRYYEVASPTMAAWFGVGENPDSGDPSKVYTKPFEEHLTKVLEEGVMLYLPPESAIHPPTMVRILNQEFPSTYGPVRYTGYSGVPCVTENPVRIASIYMILLEKTGDDWTAVSSGKLQNFGVLSHISNQDKYSQPTRTQAIRAWGETEIRIVVAYAGPTIAAELLDRNNNIVTHNQMLESIYFADKPTNISTTVNRQSNPLGNARPLQLLKHYAFVGGWEFVYNPYDPARYSGLDGFSRSELIEPDEAPEEE